MTAQPATLNGGWAGFRAVNGDEAAADAAAADLITILDAVEVPIVVLRRDLMIAGFNTAAADMLRLSPSDIGRASGDISVLAGLPFPSWHSLVGLITAGSVLMYAGAPLSLGALRGQVPEATRPYRMPAAAVLAPAAFIVADLLIYWSGFEVLWKLGIVLVLGYVIIGAFMAFDKQRPPLDWKSAVWLPAWLIGMGIISWQGQYSGAASVDKHPLPPTNTGNIPFWWDMLAVVAFSLIIYFWAMRSKLPREQVLHCVNRQAGENESGAVGRP